RGCADIVRDPIGAILHRRGRRVADVPALEEDVNVVLDLDADFAADRLVGLVPERGGNVYRGVPARPLEGLGKRMAGAQGHDKHNRYNTSNAHHRTSPPGISRGQGWATLPQISQVRPRV